MATRDYAKADVGMPQPRQQKETSISAHVVLSVSVNMAPAEMDQIVEMLGMVDGFNLSTTQSAIRREFIEAVESVR